MSSVEESPAKPDIKDSLTVVETIYHRPIAEEPSAIDNRYCRELDTKEQPYGPRKFTIENEWQSLDTGWLKENVGMFVLTNEEGRKLSVNPSEEEKKETSAHILEVGFMGSSDVWLVPPKESFRGYPKDVTRVRVRCQQGQAKCKLFVIPG